MTNKSFDLQKEKEVIAKKLGDAVKSIFGDYPELNYQILVLISKKVAIYIKSLPIGESKNE